jgi:hypothetical protein
MFGLVLVFGKDGLRVFTGSVLQFLVKSQFAGKVVYQSLEWEEGKLVLVHPTLCDLEGGKEKYHIEAERIELGWSFDQFPSRLGLLVKMEKPYIKLTGFPKMERNELPQWLDLRFKLQSGFIDWAEMGLQAQILFEKTSSKHLGRLVLENRLSKIQIEGFEEETGEKFEAAFSNVDVDILRPWLVWAGVDVHLEKGVLDGWVHCEMEKGVWARGSAHGEASDLLGWGNWGIASADLFSLDWDGNFDLADHALLGIGIPSGRIRLDCTQGAFITKGYSVQELDGSCSYYSDLGFRYEWSALGKIEQEIFPITCSGKGFWPLHSAPWMDMELISSKGLCSMKGTVNGGTKKWSLQLEQLQPCWFDVLQNYIGKFSSAWKWKEGEISCLADGIFLGKTLQQWTIQSLQAKNMLIGQQKMERGQIGCTFATFNLGSEDWKGDFSLDGLYGSIKMSNGKKLCAQDWECTGSLEAGYITASRWSGECNFDSEDLSIDEEFIQKECLKDVVSPGKKCQFSLQGRFFPLNTVESWPVEICFQEGMFELSQGLRLEQIKGALKSNAVDWSFEEISADLILRDQVLRLEATQLMKEENVLSFDVRLRRNFWDLARVVGSFKEGIATLDEARTEFLGNAVKMKECVFQEGELAKICLSSQIPWDSALSLAPLLEKIGVKTSILANAPLSGTLAIHYLYEKGAFLEWILEGCEFLWKEDLIPFRMQARCLNDHWQFDFFQFDKDLFCPAKVLSSAHFEFASQQGWSIIQEGKVNFCDQISCSFTGKIDPQGKGQILLGNCTADAAPLLSLFGLPHEIEEGHVTGQGCITGDLSLFSYEADFDLSLRDLKAGSFNLENRGTIHAFFSPEQGLILQGVDVYAESLIECKIGLVRYDALHGTWHLNHANVHIPGASFPLLLPWKGFDTAHDIDFLADIQCASDFSTLSCLVKEGFIPVNGVLRHIQNLQLDWNEQHILSDFYYFHQSHCLKVGVSINRGETLLGRVTLEDVEQPLLEGERGFAIDWEYDDHLGTSIRSIEGSFGGVEASFHLESVDFQSHLIGSARLHFGLLSKMIPSSIAEVFSELEMGKGYELKGRLNIDCKDLSQIFFQGILSGKQLELFGYQFRTLLAQVDLGPEKVRIYDLKISDSAGIFTIDELVMKGNQDQPWTVFAPLISIAELRPSLLQKPGGSPGEMSPLVVREMIIRGFEGILDDGQTYTAHGELYFINSYKRGHTVFDLPADVLGRIIGLDLELLIPVCGTLHYVLENGAFRIRKLEDAYSEGKRSQFFLVHTEDSPLLDLDGNLQIHVTMKQYVLFKLTESFVISIDGKLNNPQYHLQKKKRFFGL